mgnify:CR=1 FL=1
MSKALYGEVLADSYMPTATTVDDQLLLFAANRSTDIDYFKLE